MHSMDSRGVRESLVRFCVAACYRRADAIVRVSHGVADDLAVATGATSRPHADHL